nr:MAG TPA_asm: hypothetical protein [Caudoviricetes sp.]
MFRHKRYSIVLFFTSIYLIYNLIIKGIAKKSIPFYNINKRW